MKLNVALVIFVLTACSYSNVFSGNEIFELILQDNMPAAHETFISDIARIRGQTVDEIYRITGNAFQLNYESTSQRLEAGKMPHDPTWDLSARESNQEVTAYINQGKDNQNASSKTLLNHAISKHDHTLMFMALFWGGNIEAEDSQGNTPLHNAMQEYNDSVGSKVIIDLLLQKSITLFCKKNKDGISPAHMMVQELMKNQKSSVTKIMLKTLKALNPDFVSEIEWDIIVKDVIDQQHPINSSMTLEEKTVQLYRNDYMMNGILKDLYDLMGDF